MADDQISEVMMFDKRNDGGPTSDGGVQDTHPQSRRRVARSRLARLAEGPWRDHGLHTTRLDVVNQATHDHAVG